eukprot:1558664-Rhodomonas_salina.1
MQVYYLEIPLVPRPTGVAAYARSGPLTPKFIIYTSSAQVQGPSHQKFRVHTSSATSSKLRPHLLASCPHHAPSQLNPRP